MEGEVMKKEVKDLWMAALRSGRYPQTDGVLHRTREAHGHPEGFCCWGVLCALAAPMGVTTEERGDDLTTYGGNMYMPPDSVYEWAGLPDKDGVEVTYLDGDGYVLQDLNDVVQADFNTIADLIEAQIPGE